MARNFFFTTVNHVRQVHSDHGLLVGTTTTSICKYHWIIRCWRCSSCHASNLVVQL